MINAKAFQEYAERCRSLADASLVPEVAKRLEKLAESYEHKATELTQVEKTSLAPEA
jgi:hypothetical protein